MDRIAAEITQEIVVFFKNVHIDARPGQQKTQHYAGRTTPGDAAACIDSPGHALKFNKSCA